MRTAIFGALALLLFGAGARAAEGDAAALAKAEAFVDAFYAFDPARLKATLADAPESAPTIIFYQGWAEGGNYRVLKRAPCRRTAPEEIACAITVKDDLVPAAGVAFDVTDTFTLTVRDGRIVAVRTSSDDPEPVRAAFRRLFAEQPALFETGACKGFFAGGPTPGDCVRAVAAGFAAQRARAGG